MHTQAHAGAQPDAGTIDALLDEALDESFPASDPLSFWSGRDRQKGQKGADRPEATAPSDDAPIARV